MEVLPPHFSQALGASSRRFPIAQFPLSFHPVEFKRACSEEDQPGKGDGFTLDALPEMRPPDRAR
jgi:hypothetical protein